MRYIPKAANAPAIITNFIQQQNAIPVVPTYSDFPDKEGLNDLLRAEQRFICCYCQKPINHYNGENEGGSHNEHLVPQRGVHANAALQLAHANLYASCNYTKGQMPSLTHCGEAKKDFPITNFIQQANCTVFFKYNLIGEILPNGQYDAFQDYKNNRGILAPDELHALETIEILNLNCATLVQERSRYAQDAYRLSQGLTRIQAQHKIQQLLGYNPLPSCIEVFVYYLNLVQ